MFTPMNKIRSTDSFCILEDQIDNLIVIKSHFNKPGERNLVSVAYNAKSDRWTVRTTGSGQLIDHNFIVRAWGEIEDVETSIVAEYLLPAAKTA